MTSEHLAYLAPLLSLGIFLLMEKAWLKRQTRWAKVVPTAAIHGINFSLSLGLSAALLVPLVFVAAPYQIFSFAEWQVPVWVSFGASFLFLDLVHYWSHRLHHAIPLLWRMHRLHHSDQDVDALTTVLHHPLEVVTGFVGAVVCAVMLDIPVIVLTAYSIAFGLHAAFTHLNLSLPANLDRWVRCVIVTPNFHRVHHSSVMSEGNSNYALIFSFWDFLFMSASEKSAHEVPVFGISKDQAPRHDSIGAYLTNPLK